MKINHDVRLNNLSPQMALAAVIVAECYLFIRSEATITSGSEGEHTRTTHHRNGDALDFRTKHLAPHVAETLAAAVRIKLGPNYTVLLETNPPHLHVHHDAVATTGIPQPR